MIRIILAIALFSVLSFNAGRAYEYAQNRPDRAISAEVTKISMMLEQLPVRTLK